MITGPTRSVKLARKLRSEMSLPETLLWRALRAHPGGFKYRRQHPAGQYVLDFYCAAVRLAIEVDGSGHDSAAAQNYDARRASFLRSQHVATLRIPAKAVLDDPATTLERIVAICQERAERMEMTMNYDKVPLHQPAAGPPPRAGEECA